MTKLVNNLPAPSLDDLRRDFTYHRETGYLIWAIRKQGVPFGKFAGTRSHDRESLRIKRGGYVYPVELLVWYMHTEQWPVMLPRHRNEDKSDNTLSNLWMPEPMVYGTPIPRKPRGPKADYSKGTARLGRVGVD